LADKPAVSGLFNHELYGSGKSKQDNWWKCFKQQLSNEGYLEDKSFTTSKGTSFGTILALTKKAYEFLQDKNKNPVKLIETPEMIGALKRKASENDIRLENKENVSTQAVKKLKLIMYNFLVYLH